MMAPAEKLLALTSTARCVTPAPAVTLYQTLLCVTGAPQLLFTCASSASVVAPVVSTLSLNGSDVTTVAPALVSLGGGAAAEAAFGANASAVVATAAIANAERSRIAMVCPPPAGPCRPGTVPSAPVPAQRVTPWHRAQAARVGGPASTAEHNGSHGGDASAVWFTERPRAQSFFGRRATLTG